MANTKLNNKIKQISCVAVTVIVLLNFITVLCSNNPTLELSSGKVAAGEEIEVYITLDKPNNIVALQYTLNYDNKIFDITGYDKIKIGEEILQLGAKSEQLANNKGRFSLIIAGAMPLKLEKSIVIAKITLKAKEDTEVSTSEITLSDVVLATGIPATTTPSNVVNGSINVYKSENNDNTNANSNGNAVAPFKDIPSDVAVWAAEPINELYKIGAINGNTETEFAPNNAITRAEFTKILVSALKITPDEAKMLGVKKFDDVPNDAWFAEPINIAASLAITKGVDANLFAPNDLITREQMCVMLYRAATALGLQLLVGDSNFVDNDNISDWAIDAVNSLQLNGIIEGTGNGYFTPQRNVTKAETAKMIYQVLTKFSGGLK